MTAALRTRDELNALHDLVTAAMGDVDLPKTAADREEWERLGAYRHAILDALRGAPGEYADPDAQAMAGYLAGEGPDPLTPLGHSLAWQTPAAGEAPAAPAATSWMDTVLGLVQPVAGRAPARYVPPHPVTPAPARAPAPPVTSHAVPSADRIWLDVPYAERQEARQRGAVWDPVARSWYAPRTGMTALSAWSQLPEILPGEDRAVAQGLFVDLIPQTSWFRNVRAVVSERDWERIRKMVRRRAGQRCEACGAGADKTADRFLECHERWAYLPRGVQVLRRLICLCSPCHQVTHFGHTMLDGSAARDAAWAHLMSVTGMNGRQADAHIAEAFRVWDERSRREWTVNLTLITSAGITVHAPGKGGPAWAS